MATSTSHHSELEELAAAREGPWAWAVFPDGEVVEVTDGLDEVEVDEVPAKADDELVTWLPATAAAEAGVVVVTAGAGRTVDEVGWVVGGALVVAGVDAAVPAKATTCWELGTRR